MICWIDIETTGLEPSTDKVLEVAAVMTDDKLVEVGAFLAITDEARTVDMSEVDRVVQDMHASNGLWAESLMSGQPRVQVDELLTSFIGYHCPGMKADRGGAKDGPQLGGSTVNFDRAFLKQHLKMAHSCLHYRNVDVSTMNEMARRFWPTVYENRPKEAQAAHRALSDIRFSLTVARHYAENLTPGANRY